MTNTEFLALEFGSTVFNENGVKGVVITIFGDGDISVCFDTDKGSNRIKLIKLESADTLFLEKPKKKVKKEIVGYILKEDVYEMNNSRLKMRCRPVFTKERCVENDIKVTITYETEE